MSFRMGNHVDRDMAADSESPLQVICREFPQRAERLRNLPGVLNKELGSELLSEGGVDTVKGLRTLSKLYSNAAIEKRQGN